MQFEKKMLNREKFHLRPPVKYHFYRNHSHETHDFEQNIVQIPYTEF
jgi:hypothetical protein